MDLNNTGAMRSPFSPRVRQSITGRRPIGLSSTTKSHGKLMQHAGEQAGDVIYKTPLITVETHGPPLPVMVTEALTFGSGDVSVRMSACGWCWLVTGRRILTWPYSLNPDGSSPLPAGGLAARELTLPQTDLAHKADLVMVFYANGAQMPSCVGVSPEGAVRLWPSVAADGAHADASAELAGQECERLQQASGALVLATTTCTLVLLQPTTQDGRASVSCRTLRPPSGWLGGIGRRVSLMFFGSMPAHAETKLVGVVGVGGDAQEPHIALVAGGPVLQLWRGAELHEHSLRRALADSPHLVSHGDAATAELTALDVRATAAGDLLLLLSAAGPARPADRRYVIAHVGLADAARPAVRTLAALRAGAEGEAPRFLPLGAHVLLYSGASVAVAACGAGAGEPVEAVALADGDSVLGAELCGGVPLLFSRKHGVLLLTVHDAAPPAKPVCDSPRGSPCPSDVYDGNLSLFEVDPREISTVTTDACGKLKTAFLFHLRRDTAACRALLHELFPAPPASPSDAPSSPAAPVADVDGELDRTVMKVATEMLDDVPAGDPRWAARGGGGGGATAVALGSSAALQVLAQLHDKRRAFSLFVEFLRATGLWARLSALTTEEGGVARTSAALGALAERLAAAAALRALQQGAHKPLVDAAIDHVVGGGADEEPAVAAALAAGALAPADACYRRVSRVRRVLRALARAPGPPGAHAAPAAPAARHALGTLHVLTSVVSEMHKVRAAWPGPALPPALGPRALLPALLDLQRRAVTQCARQCPDPTLRAQVLEAAAALTDALLWDAAPLQRAERTARLYERMRRDAIQPFVEEGQTERALALAEKFQDYELLVQLCVDGEQWERLHRYMDAYEKEGMAEITFSWLAQRGGRHAALLLRRAGEGGGARLHAWLDAAPARRALAALHALAHAPPRAAAALHRMAADEHASLHRMATMASLAKLCLLAADEGAAPAALRRGVEARLALAEQHVALPRDIRLHHGLGADGDDCRVYTPEELVQMYVSAEGGALGAYEYKQALDLTEHVGDMERRDDLRLRVWCACIRRDEWRGAPADLHDKLFFKVIDLVRVMGGDLELLLPPLEDVLTAPELAELAGEPTFHYLVRRAYGDYGDHGDHGDH